MASPDQPLSRNRDFQVVLTAQAVSALGDAVSFTALPLLVLALTGSGVAMGVVGALHALPDFLFGMVAGVIADRSDRKRMMILADLGRAGLTALIPLSVALDGPTMAVILIVAAPISVLRSLFMSAYTASVPGLVGRSLIGRANSVFEAVYSVGFILGPAIAGVLAATIGPGPTLAIDAASFAVSALALGFVRRELRAPVDRPRGSVVAEIREGIDFIRGHRLLRSAIAFWSCVSVAIAPVVAALAVHITRDLGMTEAILGLTLMAFGVGTVVGALVAARSTRRPPAPILLGGTLVLGASLVVVGVTELVPALLAAAFAFGIAQSLVLVTYITLRAVQTPDELLGRVASTARVLSLGLQPVGLLVGGLLIDLTNGSTTLVVIGVALAVLSAAFLPVRALRHATAAPRP